MMIERFTEFFQKAREHKVETFFLIAFVVLLIFALFFFFGPKHGQGPGEEARPAEEGGRKIYGSSDIHAKSGKGTSAPVYGPEPPARIQGKPRNYASEICVFHYAEKEKGRESLLPKERNNDLKLGLPAGTKIPALVKDTIFSFNVEAPVIALVTRDFLEDGAVTIPKDSRFLGTAGILKSLSRINVRFDQLILPDGRELNVRALALSEDGSAGIKGKVSKHRDMRVLKALGETTLAGVSLFAGGIQTGPYSMEDNLRMNLAQNLTSEARNDLRGVKVDTSITVEGFTPVQVILLDGI